MAGEQGAFDCDSLALRDATPSSGYFSLGLLYTIYPSVKKILKIRPLNLCASLSQYLQMNHRFL